MKNLWKKLKELSPLSAAFLIFAATFFGYTISEPVLGDIVWPEMPVIEEVKAEEKEEQKEPEKEQAVGNYEDGTYKGSGTGYGGTTTVEVTVKDKQITIIDIISHQDTESYFAIAKDKIIDAILQNQTWEVDVVSGATYSSRGIKEAVCNAITGQESESALPEKTEPKGSLKNSEFKVQDWKDGTYIGSASGFGGTIKVQVTIKKGKIKSIKVLDHSKETPSYYDKAKAIISKIIKKQTPNVDTISGATYSSSGIREAVKNALNKAAGKKTEEPKKDKKKDKDKDKEKEEKEPEVPDGKPADGTYEASVTCEQGRRFSYQVTIKAVFKKGILKKLSMTTTDSGKNQSYIDEAWSVLKAAILKDQTGNVDVVSGATYTSKAIRTAYKTAYRNAVIKGGGTVEEEPEETPEEEPEKPGDTTEDTDEDDEKDSDEDDEKDSDEDDEKDSDEDDEKDSDEDDKKDSDEDDEKDSDEEETKPAGPKDGSYSVTAYVNPDETNKSSQKGYFYGYNISGTVKFKDGVLSSISNISVVYSSEIDEEYDDDVYYTNKASSGMVGKLKSANSANVDTVSGATCSSKAIIRLYQAAYQQAMSQ